MFGLGVLGCNLAIALGIRLITGQSWPMFHPRELPWVLALMTTCAVMYAAAKKLGAGKRPKIIRPATPAGISRQALLMLLAMALGSFLAIGIAVVGTRVALAPAQPYTQSMKPAADAETPAVSADAMLSSQPPVVVETCPASGAKDVASGEAEIRVRFSKPMTTDSWSWSTAWENSTPEFIDQPRYEADGRTCVVKVKLEPAKTYAFWLNSENFLNFCDSEDRPAIPYLLIFQTKDK
jgi:hypothetical protein